MILPSRLAALLVPRLTRIERRHWLGLGASAVLHLAVFLGLRQAPAPEPAPMSFEIAVEAPKPQAVARKKTKTVASKLKPKPKSKRRLAKRKPAKREAHTLEAAWRGEAKRRKDAPQVALPDARALGVDAPLEPVTRPGNRPRLAPAAGKAAVAAKSQDAPGLSEPGLPGATPALQPAPGADTGIALTPAAALAVNPAPGAGAQGSDAATSLAAVAAPAQASLHASAGQGGGPDTPAAASGAQSVTSQPLPVQASGEPQGIRLAATGILSSLPELPAGAGSLAAGPQSTPRSTDAGPAIPTPGDGPALAHSQAGNASSAPAEAKPASGGQGDGQGGSQLAGATTGEQGRGRSGAPRETPGKLAGISNKLASTQPGGRPRAAHPSAAPQAGKVLALAPGEPGSAPNLALALGTVTALPPGDAGKPRDGKSSGGKSGGAPGSDAAAPAGTAVRASVGAPARQGPGASAATAAARPAGKGGGMTLATPIPPGGSPHAGDAAVRLQTVKQAGEQIIRPDSAARPLDVLAPSSYCPLPGHSLPDNRPKAAPDATERPGYGLNNPNFIYPIQAWAYNVEGHVTVRVEVLPDGSPGKMWLKQSSGNAILDRDAQYQLSRWRFTPARMNGQPVTAWIDIPVVYRLQGSKP